MKEFHQSLCSIKLSWEIQELSFSSLWDFISKAMSNCAHLQWMKLLYIKV